MHAIMESAGTNQTHPSQNARVRRPGNSAATRPNVDAPSAAVAAQPYQYIAGARKAIAGAATSRERWVPARTTPNEGKTVKSARSLARTIT